jgi:hypothetical protein
LFDFLERKRPVCSYSLNKKLSKKDHFKIMSVRRPKSVAQIVTMEERRTEVAKLLCEEHMRPGAIARLLDVDPSTITRDIRAIRKEWKRERIDNVDEVRMREIAELDEMERICMERLRGCTAPWQGARWMEERRKIKERRAKLMGLDAPDMHVNFGAQVTLKRGDCKEIIDAIRISNDPLEIPMDDDEVIDVEPVDR